MCVLTLAIISSFLLDISNTAQKVKMVRSLSFSMMDARRACHRPTSLWSGHSSSFDSAVRD